MLTEEQLKNMSPEEIRNIQKQQCIFCHIITGKVQSKKVYEDEKVIAILDINPANPGHVLLIPKEHFAILPLYPDEDVEYLLMVAKAISQALLRALQAEGTNIFAANGIVAGQRAQHFMLHIIPRKEGDGINLTLPEIKLSEEQMGKVRRAIKKKMDEMFGIQAEADEEQAVVEKVEQPKKKEPEKTPEEEDDEDEKEAEKKEKEKTNFNKNLDLDALTSILTSQPSFKKASDAFVANSKSRKFHVADCPFARLIKEEHKLFFESEAEARKADFMECECINGMRDMQ